jgi:hypothetical protein
MFTFREIFYNGNLCRGFATGNPRQGEWKTLSLTQNPARARRIGAARADFAQ